MKEIFVSSSLGDDSNPGTFQQPFKTLAKAVQVCEENSIIYLKSGDEWREIFDLSSLKGIMVKPYEYGSSALPKINASIILPTEDWEDLGDGRYRYAYEWDVNGIFEDGIPLKKASDAELLDGNWYHDDSYIYYRPTEGVLSDHVIEKSSKAHALKLQNSEDINVDNIYCYGAFSENIFIAGALNINLDGLAIKSSRRGINMRAISDDETNKFVYINKCRLSYLGDAIYFYSNNDRYMTAINSNVTENIFEFIDYDGVWDHVTSDGHSIGLQNPQYCIFESNIIRHAKTGIVLWADVDGQATGNLFLKNFVYDCEGTSFAMGGEGHLNCGNNRIFQNLFVKNGLKLDNYAGANGGVRLNRQQANNYIMYNIFWGNDTSMFLYSLTDGYLLDQNISLFPRDYHIFVKEALKKNWILRTQAYPDKPNGFRLVDQTFNMQSWGENTFPQSQQTTLLPKHKAHLLIDIISLNLERDDLSWILLLFDILRLGD